MKKTLLIGCIFLAATSALAQVFAPYSVEPSTTYIASTDQLNDVTKFYMYFKNTTGKDLQLSWKKLTTDLPADWDYSLCDLGTCYAGIPDGDHTMFPVEKDSSGFLAPNIFPAGFTGTGKIVMLVWDKDNPSITDTLTWIITATSQADVRVQKVNKEELRLYPNPANGRVSIVFGSISTGTLSFIDLNGVSQLQLNVTEAKTFDADLSQLAAGEYVALFLSRDGSVFHAKLVKY